MRYSGNNKRVRKPEHKGKNTYIWVLCALKIGSTFAPENKSENETDIICNYAFIDGP